MNKFGLRKKIKTIGYQGIIGSYSESVIVDVIGKSMAVPLKKFRDIFDKLGEGEIDYGLIPIENNLGGSLHMNYDLLTEYRFKIVKEYNFPVNHCLIMHPKAKLSGIKKVISHPQALAQCTNFINKNNFSSAEHFDTAGSVKLIAESESIHTACIASKRSAEMYGMKIVKENIQDNKINMTRFLLITRNETQFIKNTSLLISNKNYLGSKTNKVSISICFQNKPGILANALTIFSRLNIDLTKIESRPNLVYRDNNNTPYQYIFYIDCVGDDKKINLALKNLKDMSIFLEVLGNYVCVYPKNYLNERLNIGIIGFGRFGRFLASHLMEYHNVYATSRTDYSISDNLDIQALISKSNKNHVEYFRNNQDFYSKLNNKLDCVIIATSILSFEEVVSHLDKNFLKNKLVIDVLSVKKMPKSVLLDLGVDCDILCTHPMFGPDSGKELWTNLPFVYDKVRIKDDDRCEKFISFFEKKGCKMFNMKCEVHDEYSANSQFITHLTGRILSDLNITSTPINTRGYESLLDLVECTNNDSFDLFKGLCQSNEKSIEVLKKFRNSLNSVINKLEIGNNQVIENSIVESGTSKFYASVSKYRNNSNSATPLLDFTIGQPDYQPPQIVTDKCKEVVDNEMITYTAIQGIKPLRDNICDFLKRKGLNYKSDEVLCSNGAKQCIYQILVYLATVHKQKEFDKMKVIIPSPYWTSYPSMVKLIGGEPIIHETTLENSYQLNLLELERLMFEDKNIKAIILCNPCNPTGSIYNTESMIGLAELCKKYGVYVISDEVYEPLDYENKHISIATLDGMRDLTFTVNGFSKTFAMTGYRLGYVCAPKEHISKLIAIQSQISTSPNYISQKCAQVVFDSFDSEVKNNITLLKESMELFYNFLKKLPGIKCFKPEGGMYLFPDVSYYFGSVYKNNIGGRKEFSYLIRNSHDFCRLLLEHCQIGVAPGDIFGNPNCIRIVYGVDKEKIKKACLRIQEFTDYCDSPSMV